MEEPSDEVDRFVVELAPLGVDDASHPLTAMIEASIASSEEEKPGTWLGVARQ